MQFPLAIIGIPSGQEVWTLLSWIGDEHQSPTSVCVTVQNCLDCRPLWWLGTYGRIARLNRYVMPSVKCRCFPVRSTSNSSKHYPLKLTIPQPDNLESVVTTLLHGSDTVTLCCLWCAGSSLSNPISRVLTVLKPSVSTIWNTDWTWPVSKWENMSEWIWMLPLFLLTGEVCRRGNSLWGPEKLCPNCLKSHLFLFFMQ